MYNYLVRRCEPLKLHSLTPFIRYCRYNNTWRNNSRYSICFDCRLFFIHKGNGVLSVGGENIPFSDGAAFFLPSGTVYRFTYSSAEHIYVLDFDLTDEYSEIEESLGTGSASDYDENRIKHTAEIDGFREPRFIGNAENMLTYLEKCSDLFLFREPLFRERASALLKLCLLMFESDGAKTGTSERFGIVNEIKLYIKRNFDNPSLTNKTMAKALGYNPMYLGRLFKNGTGKTLHGYLCEYRISMAKNYLVTTDLDISTVAWRVGFNSVSNFIDTFRENVGTTPLKYRRMYE